MKKRHTVADHALGEAYAHSHDGADADHDHEQFDDVPLEENPIWLQDHVTLTSVGIDIGSAGTQVLFSRLSLRREGEALTSRYRIVSRELLHQSPVALTPYAGELIDAAALGAIVDHAYHAAKISPADVDTGVVILTGEALRRENAGAIADVLARSGGDLVCASAGHHMEAMLAAYGSGAARASHDSGKRILNIDIGGGTTKLSIVDRGTVVATAALHIGGRLAAFEGNRIVRLEQAGKRHAAAAGFDWQLNSLVSPAEIERVAQYMADALFRFDFPLTKPIQISNIDGVLFSGGVAEYVYGREDRDFGDLGRALGAAIRNHALPWPLLPAGECIRATALGASQYTVQLSGNTSYISDAGSLLPRRNLPVLQPHFDCGTEIDAGRLAQAIRAHFEAFDLEEGTSEAALALRWRGIPSHERLFAFASGISQGLQRTIAARKPLYVMLDGDVAQTLGALLREELGVKSPMLVIDGVSLGDFDYVDLGRLRLPSMTVPVTVKSLVFGQDPRE